MLRRAIQRDLHGPGNDGFVVLLAQTGSEETGAVFQKLARQLASVMREGRWPVTLSAGAATFEKPPESAEQAVKLVDELMYAAGTGGKYKLEKRIVR